MDNIPFIPPSESQLRDESGLRGCADFAVRPRNSEKVHHAVRQAAEAGMTVHVQGGRSGICGAAVPAGGLVLDLSAMNAVSGFTFDAGTGITAITVQPGLTQGDLNGILRDKTMETSRLDPESLAAWRRYRSTGDILEFSPNPSEASATIGGMAATNACGSHGWRDGDMRANIVALEAILPDGSVVADAQNLAAGIRGYGPVEAQSCERPYSPGCRADAGLLGLLCGSEGVSGVISQLTLRLRRADTFTWGLLAFFSSMDHALIFYNEFAARLVIGDRFSLRCVDFFDRAALTLLDSMRGQMTSLKGLPAFPEEEIALWLELGGGDEDELMELLEQAVACLENAGGSADRALVVSEDRDFTRLAIMRHAITEAANMLFSAMPGRVIDLAVPPLLLAPTTAVLRSLLDGSGCKGVMTGHVAGGLISLRLLPDDSAVEKRFNEALSVALPSLREKGILCSAAHGVGKVKKTLFAALCPDELSLTEKARCSVDPKQRWNPGNFY